MSIILGAALFYLAGVLFLAFVAAVLFVLGAVIWRAVLRAQERREARVPDDGGPLTADEVEGILRGWKDRAPEPAYDDWSQP